MKDVNELLLLMQNFGGWGWLGLHTPGQLQYGGYVGKQLGARLWIDCCVLRMRGNLTHGPFTTHVIGPCHEVAALHDYFTGYL
ncbi:hypothetical protein G7K_5192-t1 [Saitoella complicata NRRL Y-17804]|uniref:Uncharacterized protein n=1 Tax=Saitoella complicata (strain BCRC 22490 / CBS 7301 / JCM 7358 / NBRC 10748 / NRRL Y-17804) TaxID=698492 RepID=A0A0E9NNT0_SAICN|nr:hypothetical protein G7K_5192-t1 [Saitoella complicata NRRL Y-17804]